MLSTTWNELRLGLRVTHYPAAGTPPAPTLSYYLTLGLPNLWLTLRFEDREALVFKDAGISLFNLGFCCGVQADGYMFFQKDGLNSLRVTLRDLTILCCGVKTDVEVTFTPSAKEIAVKPRWELCEACLTVYGDVLWDGKNFGGLALYGYKIQCSLPSGSIEFLTAFDPSRVPGGFQGEEFEYVKVSVCGPACCGGRYSFDATVFFSPAGLFGISRVKGVLSVPILPSFSLIPTMEVGGGGVKLGVGWQFRF